MTAASAIRAGRAAAENLMVDACSVSRSTAPVYTGRCRLQVASVRPPNVAGGVETFAWSVLDLLAHLPVSAPDLFDGDTLVVTASEMNAHLVGKAFRVRAMITPKSFETKRTVVLSQVAETFLGDSLVVLRATVGTDAYGNRVLDWTAPTATTVPAQVQPISSAENLNADTRDQTITRYEAWVGPTTDVTARDRVQYAGLTLAVDGEPLLVKDTSGVPHHKTFTMTVSRG